MVSNYSIEFQRVVALFLLSFTVSMFIVGILVNKYKFFDKKDKKVQKKGTKKKDSVSEIVGILMMFVSAVIFTVSLFVLIESYF